MKVENINPIRHSNPPTIYTPIKRKLRIKAKDLDCIRDLFASVPLRIVNIEVVGRSTWEVEYFCNMIKSNVLINKLLRRTDMGLMKVL